MIDVKQGGRTIPAVAVINKAGLLFLLDRVTGKPIYGVEERPVPPSEVPLERASKTQPFPLKPPPLARMTMSAGRRCDRHAGTRSRVQEADRGRADWAGRICRRSYNRLRVQFPGNHGGVNWGGTSFSPQLGYLFVNTNELGQLSGMTRSRPKCDGTGTGIGKAIGATRTRPTKGSPAAAASRSSTAHATAVSATAVGRVDRRRRQYG